MNVQGARVTLVRQTDASKRSASSSSDGSFRFDAVSPADYVLTVQMTGFENFQDVLTVGLENRRPMIVIWCEYRSEAACSMSSASWRAL